MLGPVLEKLEKDYGGSFLLVKVNTDLEQELAAHFRITGIPAVKLIAGGRLKDEFTGALPEAQVKAFLKKNKIEPVTTTPAEAPSGADLISQAVQHSKKGNNLGGGSFCSLGGRTAIIRGTKAV